MTAPDSRDSVIEDLRALLALAERATPGEWRAEEENADYSGGGQWYDLRVGDRNPFWYPYNGPGSDGGREKANADFVVAAVNFIRAHGSEVLQALARGPQQAGGEDAKVRHLMKARDIALGAVQELQAEVARLLIRIETLRSTADRATVRADDAEAALAEAREVLRLIAAPQRPDGTWNRDRSACQYLAEQILIRITSTSISSALPSSPQRAQDPGMEHAP